MAEFIGEVVLAVVIIVGTMKGIAWLSTRRTTYIVVEKKDKDADA